MTDGEALLAAILDDPGDDARRLVYADWLEEYGDADRAEFIRDQVLASPGARDYDLLAANHRRWWPWAPELFGYGLARAKDDSIRLTHADGSVTLWRRGFVCRLDGTYADAPEGVPWAAFTAEPILAVRLLSREPVEAYPLVSAVMPMYGWVLPSWEQGGAYPDASYCPEALEPFLLDLRDTGSLWQAEGVVVYPTRDSALGALSDACVAYAQARSRGGERVGRGGRVPS